MTIIDRYLIKELYKTFVPVVVVLVLIIFANNFVWALRKIVGGYFHSDALWQLMSLELLQMLGFLIPPAFFFAVLISLGRMYRDSEVIAMQASGIGPYSIYRSYFYGAVPVAILTALLVMFALPWAKYSMAQMAANQSRENVSIAQIETGRFQELQKGDTVFFAESRGEKTGDIKDIFIQNIRNGQLGIITAEEGYQYLDDKTGDHFLILKNGYRYTGAPGQNNYTSSKFYEYGIRIRRIEQKQAKFRSKDMPMSELWGSENIDHRTEFQFRLSIPLALFALTFLAVPLSRSLPRQGIYGRLFMAFVVYFSFMNLHKLAEKWMEDGYTPVWMGMWWLPALALLMAVLIELRDRYDYLLNWKMFVKMVKRV